VSRSIAMLSQGNQNNSSDSSLSSDNLLLLKRNIDAVVSTFTCFCSLSLRDIQLLTPFNHYTIFLMEWFEVTKATRVGPEKERRKKLAD